MFIDIRCGFVLVDKLSIYGLLLFQFVLDGSLLELGFDDITCATVAKGVNLLLFVGVFMFLCVFDGVVIPAFDDHLGEEDKFNWV
jgi:hypothetical protein